jgi:hypothetical protein
MQRDAEWYRKLREIVMAEEEHWKEIQMKITFFMSADIEQWILRGVWWVEKKFKKTRGIEKKKKSSSRLKSHENSIS